MVAMILVLMSQPLYFKWTHDTLKVMPGATYESSKSYSSFEFSKSFYINMTMMGESLSLPVGDPAGAVVYVI